METKTSRAHFDGSQILLDEPFELEPDVDLIITVLPKCSAEEREDWTRLSLESLARAYSNDEPEYLLNQRGGSRTVVVPPLMRSVRRFLIGMVKFSQ